jgi:hypothetical protein
MGLRLSVVNKFDENFTQVESSAAMSFYQNVWWYASNDKMIPLISGPYSTQMLSGRVGVSTLHIL